MRIDTFDDSPGIDTFGDLQTQGAKYHYLNESWDDNLISYMHPEQKKAGGDPHTHVINGIETIVYGRQSLDGETCNLPEQYNCFDERIPEYRKPYLTGTMRYIHDQVNNPQPNSWFIERGLEIPENNEDKHDNLL